VVSVTSRYLLPQSSNANKRCIWELARARRANRRKTKTKKQAQRREEAEVESV